MASQQAHLRQARANRAFAEHPLANLGHDGTALQWVTTVSFYVALHCLSAHLAQRGIQVRTHANRDAALADPRNGVPSNVYDAYLKLKRRSEGGRYLLWRFTPQSVRSDILGTMLTDVTSFVGL